MKLQRYFYIGENLDDLEVLERELEEAGVERPRIHVLSQDDSAVEHHKDLHEVESIMKSDLLHSTVIGLLVGLLAGGLLLWLTWVFGWYTLTGAGWLPFVLGAAFLVVYFVGAGGFLGFQTHNHHFRAFERALNDNKHVFFVDLEPSRGATLEKIVQQHASLTPAGVAKSSPRWLVVGEQKMSHFLRETLP